MLIGLNQLLARMFRYGAAPPAPPGSKRGAKALIANTRCAELAVGLRRDSPSLKLALSIGDLEGFDASRDRRATASCPTRGSWALRAFSGSGNNIAGRNARIRLWPTTPSGESEPCPTVPRDGRKSSAGRRPSGAFWRRR